MYINSVYARSSSFRVVMKPSTLVALFLTAKICVAELLPLRVRRDKTVRDIMGLSSSEAFKEVREILEARYKADKYQVINPSTRTETWDDLGTNLTCMSNIFVMESYEYVFQHMIEYCELAITLIERLPGDTDQSVMRLGRGLRDRLRFPDNLEYCMVTALYDYGYDDYGIDLELLFDSTFLLQTLRGDAATRQTVEDLKIQLYIFRDRYDGVMWYRHIGRLQQPPGTIMSHLKEIHKNVTDLSNSFCPYWKPFVSNRFLGKPASDYMRNASPFVRHVFHNEKCVVNFMVISRQANVMQKNRIYHWNCENILGTEEYGFQKYEADVMKQITKPKRETTEPIEDESYSLASLNDQLKSFSFYENVQMYYNIASNVMFVVAIKEGKKMMKGIKHAVQRDCNKNNNYNAADVIRRLRSTLSAFKSLYDKLISLMLDKNRIDVTEYPQKRPFDELLSSLLMLMDVRDDPDVERMKRICRKIQIKLIDAKYDAYPVDEPNEVKFENYHFTGPLLRVDQLYRFYDNEF